MDLLELNGDKVAASPMMLTMPEAEVLKALMSKDDFNKSLQYLFFVYDVRSPYKDMLITDRKQIVCVDRIKEKMFWKKVETCTPFLELRDKYVELITTHKQRLLMGIDEKIEEYLQFWKMQKIDSTNHDLISDTLKNANDLLILQERMERRIKEEKEVRQVGGGKATLVED